MNYRPLGRSGLTVSSLSLGTVALGVDYGIAAPEAFGRPEEADAVRLIQAALDHGVTLIDTAPAYGESERIVGKAAGRDPRAIIATKVSPPIGNSLELSLRAPQTLLVAGGIGITPIVGMAQTLAARGADVTMCYAARDDAELVYQGDLRSALGERLQTFVGSRGQRLDFDRQIAALQPQAQMQVCGPMSMLRGAQAAWSRAGRPADSLRFETFGNSGALQAETFWVRLPRHQLQIDVPPELSLLEALEANGIETLYDCRRGECGLCAMDIVSVEGTVDHRDVFFSAEEKQHNQRLCACVSRISGGGVVLDSAWRPDD